MALDFAQPHRRRNPLTGRWVQVSPQRMGRPWQGEESAPEPAGPSYDPDCYLCPGNSRVGGQANPDYGGAYVFENDFPALLDHAEDVEKSDPLFSARSSAGVCRVVCFSPDHSKSLPELELSQIRAVVDVWAEQSAELRQRFASVQIFENKGAMMGCSNPHPHGQIWATAHLPEEVVEEVASQSEYLAEHGSPMLLDLAQREGESGERVVEANADWLAIVPFWAAWPFESLVLPRFEVGTLPELDDSQRVSLSAILKALTTRYDNLFETSFPYSMGWHQSPRSDAMHHGFQLHAHFYSPLLRSASVRKFMVGYEMLAEPQRDLTPERAAEMLRATATTHFRSAS